MEKVTLSSLEQKFSSPEEEIAFLRDEVARREKELFHRELPTGHVTSEVVSAYKETHPDSVLAPAYKITEERQAEIILDLSPEEHDEKMSKLLGYMQEQGVKNTLEIVQKMNNPHIADDYERFLVQYLKSGHTLKGLKENDPVFKALHMTLYEIVLPELHGGDREKGLKELASRMEQFYAGMLSVKGRASLGPAYFTIELAVSNYSDEFIFYAGVPDTHKELFQKQLRGLYHNVQITERKDDYNIFNEKGSSVSSVATLAGNPIFPLKTYETFDHDPLSVLLESFSKIDKDGEGAAVQFIFNPVGDFYTKRYDEALKRIRKGDKVKDAVDIPDSIFDHLTHIAKEFVPVMTEKKKDEAPIPDQTAMERITEKISTPIIQTNIRIIASSHDEGQATEILSHLESSFNQFESAGSNKIEFRRDSGGAGQSLLHYFSYRLFSRKDALPLSVRELTTLLHFPNTMAHAQPQLKVAKAGTAPAPAGLSIEGTLLGINHDRGAETKVYISREDRMRHFYTIGQTGTGKTSLLKNMIIQDIRAGDGVCMIDPHGNDINDILGLIPKERMNDVIYFDPSYIERPMALNMLEYDTRFPEQKTFVVNEMLSIFDKLFDMKVAGGPMFEQYFRNAVLLTIEDPESGSTLLDVSRVLANKAFRELKLSRCKNPIVTQFWREVAEKAGGEASLANVVPYITSKFDNFLSNDIMRPIIAQEKSSFNFRKVMDEKKILLVNLSKGRLGDLNSHLIGLILVGKILMAALSRVDAMGTKMSDFFLYIDEFQNITTSSIATILSEARKYRLSLTVAHQFIAQLDPKIKDAVFGNVGSIASYRVGSEDAEFLEKQFSPVFTAHDITSLDNYHAYLKLLSSGKTLKPFSIQAVRPESGNVENAQNLKTLSYLTYGRARADVEAEIMKKYESMRKPATPL